jgi:predicted metal-dependent phosphoesterase TrpH
MMMKDQWVDLHIHSIHSDGLCTPAELVQMAARNGLRSIALADHDSLDGIDEALEAGARFGVEVIPAIELSVEFRGHQDIHLLGYYVDYRDDEFREKLARFRTRRDERGRAIVDRINTRLAGEGKETIHYEEVAALASGALGRPHIARVLVARKLARDVQDAFDRYVVPCNVPKVYFPMTEALTEIRRTGGVSVLAHPATITSNRTLLKNLLGDLAAGGLEGLEICNRNCSSDDMYFLDRLAGSLGLLKTGGSDFHGFEGESEPGSGQSMVRFPYQWVEAMSMFRGTRDRASASGGPLPLER